MNSTILALCTWTSCHVLILDTVDCRPIGVCHQWTLFQNIAGLSQCKTFTAASRNVLTNDECDICMPVLFEHNTRFSTISKNVYPTWGLIHKTKRIGLLKNIRLSITLVVCCITHFQNFGATLIVFSNCPSTNHCHAFPQKFLRWKRHCDAFTCNELVIVVWWRWIKRLLLRGSKLHMAWYRTLFWVLDTCQSSNMSGATDPAVAVS